MKLHKKLIAAAIGLTLTAFAAVGAFASQDGVSFKNMLSGGVLGTETTPSETATETATATATETPEATDTTTATATASVTADADDLNDDEGNDDREIKGIPTSNPNHHPEDGDDECEKGETSTKTTPSGTQVNVPCQAAGDHGNGHDGDHSDDEEDDHHDSSAATPTPEATATP